MNCVNDAFENHLRYMGIEPVTKPMFLAMKALTMPQYVKPVSWTKKPLAWVNKRMGYAGAFNWDDPKVIAAVDEMDYDTIDYGHYQDDKGILSDDAWEQIISDYIESQKAEQEEMREYLDDAWTYDGKPAPIPWGTSFSYTYDGVIPWLYEAMAQVYDLEVYFYHRLWTPEVYKTNSETEVQLNIISASDRYDWFGKEVVNIDIEPAVYVRLTPAHAHFGVKPPAFDRGCVMAAQLRHPN